MDSEIRELVLQDDGPELQESIIEADLEEIAEVYAFALSKCELQAIDAIESSLQETFYAIDEAIESLSVDQVRTLLDTPVVRI